MKPATFHLLLTLAFSMAGALPMPNPQGTTCSPAEAGQLKCADASSFYLCGLSGQAPIVQPVAAGTQCINNTIVSMGMSGAAAPPAAAAAAPQAPSPSAPSAPPPAIPTTPPDAVVPVPVPQQTPDSGPPPAPAAPPPPAAPSQPSSIQGVPRNPTKLTDCEQCPNADCTKKCVAVCQLNPLGCNTKM